jgi:hypothetical protein
MPENDSLNFNLFNKIFANIFHLHNVSEEDALANRVAIELRTLTLEGKLKCIWFHVPNEIVIRDIQDFSRLRKYQSIGQISGVSDFVFLHKKHPLCIELKVDKGYLSEAQQRFKEWCKILKVPYLVAKSYDDVLNALKKYKLITI